MNRRSSIVLCVLPKAGLGNMLFPLMKAYVFATLNNLPLVVTGYHRLTIGPYLRGEKSKRNYDKFFVFQKNIWGEFADKLRITKLKNFTVVNEPLLVQRDNASLGQIFRFHTIPHWVDYFNGLREHRSLVIDLFNSIVKREVLARVERCTTPVIGIHIRMGDYRPLRPGEDFKRVGTVRTPEMYFYEIIHSLRKIHGSTLPVSIFTNGFSHELKNLLSLDQVAIVEGNRDIEDMILLSKSKIVVTSAGSTFGYWGGFLSDAPMILHPDHIHQPIRCSVQDGLYEGALDTNNASLKNAVMAIG